MRPSFRALVVGVALAASLTVAGCSPTVDGESSVVAAELQQTVLEISVAVAAEDWQAADDTLTALEAQVAEAETTAAITAERAADIRAAMELLRGDVAAALEALRTDVDTDVPEEEKVDGDDQKTDTPGNSGENRNDDKKDD